MRQTLFFIPHSLFGVPVFGFGWMLLVWAILSIVVLATMSRRHGWSSPETKSVIPMLGVVGLAIFLLLPMLEVGSNGGPLTQIREWFGGGESIDEVPQAIPRGLPIRGYGVMMLAGVVCGVAMAAQRARRVGLDPEAIYTLTFWMFLGGIGGARGFYVIQKWPEFQRETLAATIGEIVKFTEGGLVVYGSLFGGLAAAILFCRRYRFSPLAIGDLIAPCLAAGLAFGRIGCLMNGCCWGGSCDVPWLGVTFPPSPPYIQQLYDGELLGMKLAPASKEDGSREVISVEPRSLAAEASLQPGDRVLRTSAAGIDAIGDALRRARTDPDAARRELLVLQTSRGRIGWTAGELPSRTRPVHPTQIYSSINAALLALLLWFLYPLRQKDGQMFALMLTLYPISRILLESIRVDEQGMWGTGLSISQVVSLGLLAFAAILWLWLRGRPRQTEFAKAVPTAA